jgi:hypothetical protein
MSEEFKPPIPPLPPELAQELRFETFYNRSMPVVDGEMMPYTMGQHYLSTKQVPSALLLRKTGSPTLKKVLESVQEYNIPVNGVRLKDDVLHIAEYDVSEDDSDHIIVHRRTFDVQENIENLEEEHESKTAGFQYPKGEHYSLRYEDPFRVIGGRFLARAKGYAIPKLLIFPGDGHSLTGKIPGHVLGKIKGWTGSAKNSIGFAQIKDANIKADLLLEHTYWGKLLSELASKPYRGTDGRILKGTTSIQDWASTLIARIFALLNGRGDPLWGPKRQVYATRTARPEKHRAIRFLELLKTVDGLFMQCYVAVPEQKWTWRKFDMFTLKNLSCLIGDEFFDGDVKKEYHDITTRYTELKRARKTFKSASNMEILGGLLADKAMRKTLVAPWLRWMLPVWEYTRSYSHPFDIIHADGTLSQTRGAGQPPDSVKMQSKRKFLSTISEEPPPLTNTEKAVLRASIRQLDRSLPENVFTGLDTKARVTLNANACWEKSQQEGGTLDAISEIVHLGTVGVPCKIRDLFSGEVESEKLLSEISPGTYVFWTCLDEVLKSDPSQMTRAALVMISEPGKARTVTKAKACLKVVLDVVNKICSHPMSKIESSKSGMTKSSHAWNAFKAGWTPEGKKFVFNEESRREQTMPDGSTFVKRRFRDVYTSSTDYEEATDSMHHEIARTVSKYWMKKCGIPPILQSIVLGTCYVPRSIVFEAYGPMAGLGTKWTEDSPFREPEFVTLRKGVLMGDPLTKVTLHLVNILVRITGAMYQDPRFLGDIFPKGPDDVKVQIDTFASAEVNELFVPQSEQGFKEELESETEAGQSQTSYKTIEPVQLEKFYNAGFRFDLSAYLMKDVRFARRALVLPPAESNLPETRKAFTFKNAQLAATLRVFEQQKAAERALRYEQEEQRRIRQAVSGWKLTHRTLRQKPRHEKSDPFGRGPESAFAEGAQSPAEPSLTSYICSFFQ